MLQTRIPIPRLIDWLDQAILYLHVGGPDGTTASRTKSLDLLHAYGIRKATDLDNAFAAAETRQQLDEFLKILPPASDSGSPRLQVIKDAIEDEEWMANIRNWRKLENVIPPKQRLRVVELA